MKCNVCKRRCRPDGFCSNCQRYTSSAKNTVSNGRYFNVNGTENRFNELSRQKKWLEYKISTAKDGESKREAKKKLDEWIKTHDKWVEFQKQRFRV